MNTMTRVSLKIKWLRFKRAILRLLFGLALVALLTGCNHQIETVARLGVLSLLCLLGCSALIGLYIIVQFIIGEWRAGRGGA